MIKMKTWNRYFLDMLPLIASRSKDPHTQMGAIIVGPKNEIRATGYNSFPRGIKDDVPERLERDTKYSYIEHSERNAIYAAARVGVPLEGCKIYITCIPCFDCARAIIQSGIINIIIDGDFLDKYNSLKYTKDFEKVKELLEEAGVNMDIVHLI